MTPLRFFLVGCLSILVAGLAAGADISTTGRISDVPTHKNTMTPMSWIKTASSGTTVSVRDGWLGIQTFANSRAHVEATLPPNDEITYSACVRYLGSLYIVWDKKNWCALGKISPTPFGRYYSRISKDGSVAPKQDYRGINAGAPQWIRIQLTRDHLRFQYSFDRKEWHLLNLIDRPQELAGAPKLVVLGKEYTDLPPVLEPQNEVTTEPGGRIEAYFNDIAVEPIEPGANTVTPSERKWIEQMTQSDPLGREVLAREEDPDFMTVARYFPGMQRPREVVGVPEHPLHVGINHRAQIDRGPWEPPLGWIEVGDPPVSLEKLAMIEERGPMPRMLRDGYLPIVTLRVPGERAQYEQTIFGWSEGFAVDKDLYGYVRLHVDVFDKTQPPTSISLVYNGGKHRKSIETSTTQNAADGCFRFKMPDLKTAEAVDPIEFERKLHDTTEFWRKTIKRAERFTVPDMRVMNGYRAWYAYSLINCDTINGRVESHDGSGFYEMIYGYSMSLHTVAFDQLGLKEDTERRLATQLHFQAPDGLYVQECGLPDHGSLTWAIGQHYMTMLDDAWLRSVAEKYLKLCEWIVRQRAAAPKDGMTRGLIKFRPYNDYPQPVFNYLGNSYCCLGLELAGRTLADIGMTTEAKRFADEGAAFRKDIMDSMRAATFERDGMRLLPIEPDTRRLLELSSYRGGDYYGLVASSLLENDFLAPDSEQAQLLVDALEKRKGLILGMCEFSEGIDHAYTYGYWRTQLFRGDVRKVLLGFWGMFAYGMTRDTFSPVECTYHVLGENHYTLPHQYSCTQQLRLLRDMLVFENGDALLLAQAIPSEWLQPGKRVAVNDAPTLFGPMSYELVAREDGSVKVHIDPPTRNAPSEIRVYLRDPQRRQIASITPADVATVSGRAIVIKQSEKPIDLTVTFK